MSKLFWRAIKATPVVIGASLLAANSALAQATPAAEAGKSVDGVLNQIDSYNNAGSNQTQTESLSQVTNVNQLRDVYPTDWAYEALRSLVDRYGCIVGYPNQTYRGSRPLSRYEFAAGLNACLNQIERLIASSEAIVREDLDTLNRLVQEFEAELATLSGRVDNLESRTAFLEDHQFSTTTKLNGEAIFAVADSFGGEGDDDTQTTFSSRVRLNFDTSFTGRDRLRTRLEAGNITRFNEGVTGTDSTRLGFDTNNDNDIEVTDLWYRFPVGDKITAFVGPTGLDLDDIFEVNNPVLESSGGGALSRFNRRNPLVFRGPEGAGAGVKFELTDTIGINALYLAEDASSPEEGEGLFNGSYSAGGQLAVSLLEDRLNLSATYVRSYQTGGEIEINDGEIDIVGNPNLTGGTISSFAQTPFIDENGVGLATTANRFGVGADYALGDRFVISAFGGYIDASSPEDDDLEADIWSWGATVSLLDLVREGSVLAVGGGQLPKLTDGEGGVQEDDETSYLIEALYKFPINDNIAITPGAYVVLNPDGEDEDSVWVGVLRTTFKF
ncbi:MAG: iron uptake porin [Xenococcaceae cyanobacterium MO_188.B29]|nr:iron uptake porin [Xenococcaceae cyanobacterium MO_188.B29]